MARIGEDVAAVDSPLLARSSEKTKVWGRTGARRSWFASLLASLPMILAPLVSLSTFIALQWFAGSLSAFFQAVLEQGFWHIYVEHGPQLTLKGVVAVVSWILFQAALFVYLPAELRTGQVTPAGNQLTYRLNGLQAWIITHAVYLGLCLSGVLDTAFIPRNWSELVAAANLAGWGVTAFAFVKAHAFPSHPADRKFSGNSRLTKWYPSDISNMAYQYQTRGHVELALELLTILHVLYVGDFFVHEDWYLGTIDIHHDHYGFYLAWGILCFLPTTYTIQAQYLGMYPSTASTTYLVVTFAIGVVGYVMFRIVNNQRTESRRVGKTFKIWGKTAQFIDAPYMTADGEKRESLLLCSGFWGWSRHANYVCDLVYSYSTCAMVHSTKLAVWTYAIFMTIILIHRTLRDEKRMAAKYGDAWVEYCQRVSWRLTMERHSQAVEKIAAAVRGFFDQGEPYRVFHGSSNSTRPSHGSAKQNIVDISMLSNILLVDPERRIALVEPNVPMDRLVEATLAHGLVPPVVMEFPGITVGGGYSGTSGESSSFRHGFFDDTINSVEIILGNGSVITASRTERADLFLGAAGAAGTLGIVTLVELRLETARKLVKTTYRRINTVGEAVAEIEAETKNEEVDYIDGIVFSQQHSVIITGELTDKKPADCQLRTFSNAGDPWFYMHVQDITKGLEEGGEVVEYIPLGEYLFRYDRAGFWVGRQGYTYFKVIPFCRFFRWLLDDYSHTRTLYHALHASGIAEKFVVQDLTLPYATAEKFVDWVDEEFGIWPLWLCPLRGRGLPTFHPVTEGPPGFEKAKEERKEEDGKKMSQPMLNIGVWGWGPQDYETFVRKNRGLEAKLAELGGRKWLYAHTYYTEREFWAEYDRTEYDALREKYFGTTLPTVYDKVKPKTRGMEGKKTGSGEKQKGSWLSTWPIGGVYGMVLATLSGDIGLHRKATWRYKGK
ncbi:ergosterol biosynthesis ERG4/ERG24 family-domain-containing protein [Podospora australis]|uniref:Delta(24)-sterol reductase n=1 Tax=Podospora australis TaxID=1536484 RepID=A0AAN7ADJ8_9PEZI|nr:ergosterol biosynthesis ERG4/ERG24 family-domain-containing protein [Podospora australis]